MTTLTATEQLRATMNTEDFLNKPPYVLNYDTRVNVINFQSTEYYVGEARDVSFDSRVEDSFSVFDLKVETLTLKHGSNNMTVGVLGDLEEFSTRGSHNVTLLAAGDIESLRSEMTSFNQIIVDGAVDKVISRSDYALNQQFTEVHGLHLESQTYSTTEVDDLHYAIASSGYSNFLRIGDLEGFAAMYGETNSTLIIDEGADAVVDVIDGSGNTIIAHADNLVAYLSRTGNIEFINTGDGVNVRASNVEGELINFGEDGSFDLDNFSGFIQTGDQADVEVRNSEGVFSLGENAEVDFIDTDAVVQAGPRSELSFDGGNYWVDVANGGSDTIAFREADGHVKGDANDRLEVAGVELPFWMLEMAQDRLGIESWSSDDGHITTVEVVGVDYPQIDDGFVSGKG